MKGRTTAKGLLRLKAMRAEAEPRRCLPDKTMLALERRGYVTSSVAPGYTLVRDWTITEEGKERVK